MRLFRIALAAGRKSLHFLETDVVPHIPFVIFLTLGSVILHHKHLLDVTDSFFLRWAVQDYLIDQSPQEGKATRREDPGDRIQVLEASPAMRVAELEAASASPEVIERVGGVRPLDREKLAGLLGKVADQLQEQASHRPGGAAAGALPKVVAIDMDVAPLGEDKAPAMVDALNRLRQHATVIAIVMERTLEKERSARNQFMRDAGCTRSDVPQSASDPPNSLYFASPAVFPKLFRNFETFPKDFPFGENTHVKQSSHRWQPVGTHLPSLSNLVYLSAWGANPDATPAAALTLLCDQAWNPPAGGLLLQDIMMNVAADACDTPKERPRDCDFDLERYALRGTNWGLQKRDLVGWVPLDSAASLDARAADLAGARVLLLAVDGGAGHDKFRVPTFTHRPMGGSQLHAWQAISARGEMNLDAESARGLAVDVAVGTIFLLLWRPLRRLGPLLPAALTPIFHAIGPLAVSIGVGYWYINHFAPMLIGEYIWVNPAYVLAGLALHAYVEGMHTPGPPEHHALDLTFGLAPMVEAMRLQNLPAKDIFGITTATALRWLVLVWGGSYVALHVENGLAIACSAALVVAAALALNLWKGLANHAPTLQSH